MEANDKMKTVRNVNTILFWIFLILKLGGWGIVATWSWWWVFSPFWIPAALALVYVGILSVILIIKDIFKFLK